MDLLTKYGVRPVPRYTSYPTAPHFGPAGILPDFSVIDPEIPVSLYAHMAYCREMCWYCGCNMKLSKRYEPIARYKDYLLRELALLRDALPSRLKLSHMHWGGGTPTVLSPQDLNELTAAFEDAFDFEPNAERAIECDPRVLSDEMIAEIGVLGFTRASFGVQEFDARVQKAINRIQPVEMVEAATNKLRSAGVGCINFDLIYGLPFQTVESLEQTVEHVVRMAPDRIALFGYAHVPWFAKNQRMIDEATLPNGEQRAAQAQAAAEALTKAGYVTIGLDHFARPEDSLARAAKDGTLRRNFQGYTTDAAETLLGLGITSIGRTPQGYYQNITDVRGWERAIDEGRLPIAKTKVFEGDDLIRARVIEHIMCGQDVVLDAHGPKGWWRDALPALQELMEDGLIRLEGGMLHICERGGPYLRVIAAAFDSYLKAQNARHSVAV
ncbi:MAG: oxygen-independent coproporphyrinogen III oxidase [Sphingomonadales bacterium]